MTKKTRTMIQLDDDVIKELKRLAYENNTSVAAVIRDAINAYLQNKVYEI